MDGDEPRSPSRAREAARSLPAARDEAPSSLPDRNPVNFSGLREARHRPHPPGGECGQRGRGLILAPPLAPGSHVCDPWARVSRRHPSAPRLDPAGSDPRRDRAAPARSGALIREEVSRLLAPYSRWGAASGFPARWNPPPIPDTESLGLGALARSRAPCARSTHRLLGAGLAAMSSADRSSGPGPVLTGLRLTDRVGSRGAARLGRSTSWGLKSAASTRNAKSPALSPESGRNPHPAPGFPHLCPQHLRPRSTITRRPASSLARPSPGAGSRGDRS